MQDPQLGAQLAAVREWETDGATVSPPALPEDAAPGTATPGTLPGGRVVTSEDLHRLLEQSGSTSPLIVDVAGGPQRLPGAELAQFAGKPGDFADATQRQLAIFLSERTRERRDFPIVFYCDGPECWSAYNAALRAIELGYTNVGWYRGGLAAWQRAGLQSRPPNWGVGPDGRPWEGPPGR